MPSLPRGGASPPFASPTAPAISVIVPTIGLHADALACCKAILPQLRDGDEFVLVLDGNASADCTVLPSEVRVVAYAQRRGPAFARNRGAEAAAGDVFFFVDADCIAAPDALARVRAAFSAPGLDALVGSYDDAPAHPSFLSQYRNLLHHYTHQTAAPSLSTFWGACGAVRASVFARVGGFDEAYGEPCIEDVELGYRLKEAGCEIRLDKNLQVKHRKAWSAWGMLHTDVFRRAAPWTKLLLRKGSVENNLNVDVTGRLSTALVGGLLLTAVVALWMPAAVVLGIVFGIAFYTLNAPFYRFLRRKRGRRFAARAVPWHALYYICAGFGFVLGTLRHFGSLFRSPSSSRATSSRSPLPSCLTYSSREPAPLD